MPLMISSASRSCSAMTAWVCVMASPTGAVPTGTAPGHPPVGLDGRPHLADGEVRVPGVVEHVEDQRPVGLVRKPAISR